MFWLLIDRWGVKDAQALTLIDRPPSASGKRPRFALSTEQIERFNLLARIDMVATDVYGDPGEWLRRPNSSTLFGRKPPIATMIEGLDGMSATLAHLERMAMGASVAAAKTVAQKPLRASARR